ncbi:putative phosphatase regulatory subunit-domain-containing protein [Copromyces sp. CBS 386.78]|nr:putative phosphatase regulatory subunit-domain-containing protein [Copromyces sp. CBS 386.78]
MPYTPPSHRSPASSAPSSPIQSRRPSINQAQNGGGPMSPTSSTKPVLPRSASYLMKHRRTPSAPAPTQHNELSPSATVEDFKTMALNSIVRQSPPPITGERPGMPAGAVISPPDSASEDEGQLEMKKEDTPRGRTIENLKELKDAISQIPVHRSCSPNNRTDIPEPIIAEKKAKTKPDAGDLLVLPSQAKAIADMQQKQDAANGVNRRFSHTRSATESHIVLSKSMGSSLSASEEDTDEERQRKPPMVRKKSGELVRPALRPPSRRRPSSMPGTPTFKAVHFDSHLEHVRHFLQVDRPLAVSAGSSPVDNYDSDTEYPFNGTNDNQSNARQPPFEWELVLSNFPTDTPARRVQPVRLERVWLSSDQKCLIGSVAVVNLAFHKSVTCRFTLDYWKTTSEVSAEYMSEITPADSPLGQDRFNFTIKLSDMANLESKTLYFCVRYNVNGQEHWDSNNGINFQIDFRKKALPTNGKKGVIGAASRPVNGLPKSNRRSNQQSAAPKAKFAPIGSDDFGGRSKLSFDSSLDDYDSLPAGLRLRGVKSTTSIPSDNLPSRLSAPSGQAFANRYDFGASLATAIQTAKDNLPKKEDGALYMKSSRKPALANSGIQRRHHPTLTTPVAPAPTSAPAAAPKKAPAPAPTPTPTPVAATPAPANSTSKPSLNIPGVSTTGSIASSSYEELVNKYCFFGSTKQSSPQLKDGSLRNGRFDSAADLPQLASTSSSNNSSYEGSPVHNNFYGMGSTAQHHSLHPRDPNPYFSHGSSFMSFGGGSPAESPLKTGFQSQQQQNPVNPSSNGSRNNGPGTNSFGAGYGTGPSYGPNSTGTSSNEYPYHHSTMSYADRFPFHTNNYNYGGAEAHAATAIRG